MGDGSLALTELNLVQVLGQASDPRHAGSQAQRFAEQQLKLWETQKGFHFLLQSVYLNLSCPLDVRWLAIIQFKNGVEKYWRSTRINAIGKDEKASIRARLFDLIDENNNQLGIQNSQAAARIARLDFPGDWPTLFEDLEHLLGTEAIWQDNVRMFNLLLIMNQMIKTLATARIGRCRPAMQSKSPLVFPLLVRTYLKAFNEWTSAASVDEESLSQIQVSYLALKVLRRLVTEGCETPHRNVSIAEFLQISINHFELLMTHFDNYKGFDNFEKFVRCYGKLYYSLICASPSNFILLPCSLQVLTAFTKLLIERAPDVYRENAEVDGNFWEQIAIRSFLILKRLINLIHKKGAVTIKAKNDKYEVDVAVKRITSEFLNENLIKKWVDLLMDWYLKLRKSDLEDWSLDPEEWINEQLATSYEYQIRPCAENFFQDLINSFPDLLVPYLLNKIQTEASSLNNSVEDLLKKDAIFASFQLSATSISEAVDFDTLLVNVFLPEALNPQQLPEFSKIVKRRVALVINEWSTIKCSEESKQACYKFFYKILTEEEDKVVRLTAIQSLRTLVDDWNFDKNSFQPYLDDFVVVLLKRTLPSVSLTETRLYVLNTLSDIIVQTKPLVSRNLLVEILQVVPELWELSMNDSSESILANALLRLLRRAIDSLGKNSPATWQISLPITLAACDPSSPQYSLLYEDGFELWQSLLQNYSPSEQALDETFFKLVPFLKNAVQNQTEILPTLLEIVKSYALVLPESQFLNNECFFFAFSHLSGYLLKLRDDSFDIVLSILDILTLARDPDNDRLLLEFLLETGMLPSIFNALFREDQISLFQAGQLLQTIARIAYFDPGSIIQLLEQYRSALPTSEQNSLLPLEERKVLSVETPLENVINKLVTIWILCFKDFFDPRVRKIHILGLSSMLRTQYPAVISEIASIVSLWVEFLEETNETTNGDCEKYYINDPAYGESQDDSEEHILTCEHQRLQKLVSERDPAHNVSLKEHITYTLQYLETEMGPQFQTLLSSVDEALIQDLRLFLSIPAQK